MKFNEEDIVNRIKWMNYIIYDILIRMIERWKYKEINNNNKKLGI